MDGDHDSLGGRLKMNQYILQLGRIIFFSGAALATMALFDRSEKGTRALFIGPISAGIGIVIAGIGAGII